MGNGRFRLWFEINYGYFEDAHLYVCRRDNPKIRYEIDNDPDSGSYYDLGPFSVYGTTFDISRDSWRFENGEWLHKSRISHC